MLPKQEKLRFKLKNLIKKILNMEISLKKLELLIIKLLKRLTRLINKIFYNKIILTKKQN